MIQGLNIIKTNKNNGLKNKLLKKNKQMKQIDKKKMLMQIKPLN